MRWLSRWLEARAWRRKIEDEIVRLLLVRSSTARLVAEHNLLCACEGMPSHVRRRLLRERGLL